ncbi:MAG: polyprenyl synthetase family protein [Bdellovibrionota bacterium]
MQSRAEALVRFLDKQFVAKAPLIGHERLSQSIRYSLLQEGGKRFRPVLAMLTAEALGAKAERVLPFAAAVECVHTYSLVHDDLPAMDDDDFRRGQPTNHKKFDEATAILAGDALLTEAFQMIADHYTHEPAIAVRAIQELAHASGFNGMVGGQAIDMASKKESIRIEELRKMHNLKTGALIRVSAVGAAIVCGAKPGELEDIARYSENLGLAFQVADDLLDFDLAKPEPGSYPALLGPEKTKDFLDELTRGCLASLEKWPASAEPLRQIAIYNQRRSN